MHRTQNANFHQLAKLKGLVEEAGLPGDHDSKCKSKLSTNASEEAISMAFLYKCSQSWRPVACMSHTPKKPRESACSNREGSFGPSPEVQNFTLFMGGQC